MRIDPTYVLLLGLALGAGLPAAAAPPAPGVEKPAGPTCFLNLPEVHKRAAALRAARKAPDVIGQPPTNLAPHILVLRIQFSGKSISKSLSTTQSFFADMRNFYIENSYGVFVPTFTVSSVFTLPATMATYGADCGGDVACHDQEMFDAAVLLAQASMGSFAPFDHVMLYHAGNGQETSGVSTDIWSVYFPNTQTLGGKSFPGFTLVPESEFGSFSPLGVIVHEYGHQLGLPDLYDTSVGGGRSTMGAWDVMDYPYTGATAGDGSNPPHLGAWSKKFLGFSATQATSGTFALSPAETSRTSFPLIRISGAAASEYFLAEYRLRTAAVYDRGIAMSGLLVWHVDDAVALDAAVLSNNAVNAASQNGAGHRGVEVAEADDQEANPSSNDLGLGDAFVDGDTFGGVQAESFAGTPSGVTITNISGVGTATLTTGVALIQSAATQAVLKALNYPNPGGDAAKYPVRAGAPAGTLTTFVIQLAKSATAAELSLDLYALTGDRVRSIDGGQIPLKIGAGEPSADFKWVYEYDWDGRNDDGDQVAPGVYFYRFKAGDEFRTGKTVIVR